MAARVSQMEGLKYDRSNHLLMHAVGPNLAGVIGSAAAAGMFIAMFDYGAIHDNDIENQLTKDRQMKKTALLLLMLLMLPAASNAEDFLEAPVVEPGQGKFENRRPSGNEIVPIPRRGGLVLQGAVEGCAGYQISRLERLHLH
jgi:hypothetical protein